MKVTRSYWLGLGSGFILSAMLAAAIVPLQGQALNPNSSAMSQNSQPQTNQTPLSSQTQQTIKPQEISPSADSSSIERNFVIPQGSSLGWIADQLVAQGLIKNKMDFLATAHQMGVEVKFKAGTFKLSLGLTPEEIIRRLLKS
jgi:Predicted periplasmic solute-binding protein